MSIESYDKIYQGMINGDYREKVYSLETGKTEVLMTVRLVQKACNNVGIDFNDFMIYARKRKNLENSKDR